jgi:murein DD-endopeptidase MepM/ murein hydrolase activator NlpD
MRRLRRLLRKAFTPITIMIVPHSKSKLLRLRIPLTVLVAVPVLWGIGTFYVISVGVQTVRYSEMSRRLSYFSSQFLEMRSTLSSLQAAEEEFRRLFSLKSKKRVLEAVSQNETGSPDLVLLKKQVAEAMASVTEIRQYIREERDAHFATPMGWPVPGALSSGFGRRANPQTGEPAFHSGLDIRVSPGTQVKATADGIVMVSGWVGGNGNIVVIEHGHDFNTAYAHNTQNLVKVGQRVKRGDTIAISGATGNTTGPHLHYEVWKRGIPTDPISFLGERS